MTTDTRPDIPLGFTRDAQGRDLTFKDYKGYWFKFTRDTHGNELTFTNSNGHWWKYTRNARGNVLTFKSNNDYWYEYTRNAEGRELAYKDNNGLWTILAIDPDYALRHNAVTGVYWAGCREFTAEQALDHWSVRDDARAMQFTAAIINHLGEMK